MQTMTLDSPREILYNYLSRHTAGLRWPNWIQVNESFLVASAKKDHANDSTRSGFAKYNVH